MKGLLIALCSCLLVVTGCSWSTHFEYAEDDVEFAMLQRCFEVELKEARASGRAVIWSEVVSRKHARDFRRLIEKVESGVTPTENDYVKAGCVEIPSNT